jgi:uncharacterized protein YktA (UPF0223 family)
MSFYAQKGLWYVYLYYWELTNTFYIGSKKGDNKDYESSSTDTAFKHAIKTGLAKCHIVWTGESEEKALALEAHLIAYAKDNFIKVANKNAGGGLASPNFSVLVEEDKQIGQNALVNKIFPSAFDLTETRRINQEMYQLAVWAKDAVKDMLDKKENPLVQYLVKRNVDELISLPVIQIREVDNVKDHVDGIASRMKCETAEKFTKTTRAVSIVKDDKKRIRCNGQHTLLAIKQNNDYPETYCLELPMSLFHNSYVNVEVYATQCNLVEEVASRAPDPKKEIKLRLATFYKENFNLFNMNEYTFLEKFKATYERMFTPQQIAGNYNAWKEAKEEEKRRGDNFVDYRNFKGIDLLDKIAEMAKAHFKTEGVTKVGVGELDTVGFINSNNYFANISPFEDTAVVLAHHTSTKTEHQYKAQLSRLHRIYDFNDWVRDSNEKKNGIIPYVKKDKKVYIVELPSRIDNLKAGSGTEWANYIFSMVFNPE